MRKVVFFLLLLSQFHDVISQDSIACNRFLVEISSGYKSLSLDSMKVLAESVGYLDTSLPVIQEGYESALLWVSYKAQELEDFEEMATALEKVSNFRRSINEKVPEKFTLDINQRYVNMYIRSKQFSHARKKAIENLKILEDSRSHFVDPEANLYHMLAHRDLGTIAEKAGNIQKALDHYSYIINHREENTELQTAQYVDIKLFYQYIAAIQLEIGNLDLAERSLEMVQINTDSTDNNFDLHYILDVLLLKARLYLLKEDSKKLEDNFKIIERLTVPNSPDRFELLSYQAEYFVIQGAYQKAEAMISRTQDAIKNYSRGNNEWEANKALRLAQLDFTAIKISYREGRIKEALHDLKKLLAKYEAIKQVDLSFYFQLLEKKLEYLRELNDSCGYITNTEKLVMELHNQLYKHLNEENQNRLVVKYSPYVLEAISYAAYDCEDKKSLIPFFMEANKSVILKNNYHVHAELAEGNHEEAEDYKSLVRKQDSIKRLAVNQSMISIQNRLFESELKKEWKSSALVGKWNPQNRTENIYTDVYLLSIWEAENKVHVYHEYNKDSKYLTIPADSLRGIPTEISKNLGLKPGYSKLYNLLEFDVQLLSQAKQLLISPHGRFHDVAFDALVTSTGEYLLELVPISYSPSFYNFDHSLIQSDERKLSCLYMAPFSSSVGRSQDERTGLRPLPHSESELAHINEMLPGHIELADSASKSSFVDQAEKYDIIHLATHAKIYRDKNESISYVAFAQVDSDGEILPQASEAKLYLNEIGALLLKAKMVVLSACETSLGNFVAGEGISIARNFIAAGASSVVSTLWQINDQSSSMIMKAFYGALKDGKRKDEALRIAKLEYLKSVDSEYRHPYYWAGFVVIGDASPIITPSQLFSTYWSLCFVFLAFAYIFSRKQGFSSHFAAMSGSRK